MIRQLSRRGAGASCTQRSSLYEPRLESGDCQSRASDAFTGEANRKLQGMSPRTVTAQPDEPAPPARQARDNDFVVSTLRDLVRIESVNPSLDDSGSGEGEAAEYVATIMDGCGLEVTLHEPAPDRVSVVARLRGRGGGRSLVLNGHIDTVDVSAMHDPFGATVHDGRMYGRGAYDMKGGVVACMAALQQLAQGPRPAGDVILHAVADEEHSSLGTYDLVRELVADAAIVTEPTSLRLCTAHKGFVWMEVTVTGRAAHGSQHDIGIDANVRLGRFLAELELLAVELRARTGHPLLGSPSIHAAVIRGGTGMSTYAANAVAGLERRTIPGETEAAVVGEVQAILDRLRGADDAFQASLKTTLARPWFEARSGSEIAAAVSDAARLVLGAAPQVVGENPWMDASIYAAAGIDTVVIGPHGAGAHAANEWVDLASVKALADILARTAQDFCNW
jgi:acetylornithine deacetylase